MMAREGEPYFALQLKGLQIARMESFRRLIQGRRVALWIWNCPTPFLWLESSQP